MIGKEEVMRLLTNTETFNVERTTSTTDTDKFCEAICAFANDMPNVRQSGYLLIGAHDDGRRSGLKATDELLKNLSSIRSDGNILPIPVMNVGTVSFDDGDVVVIEVDPSLFPPVRYRGRTWIRVGPRRSIATIEEEDRLVERRASNFPTYDCTPCRQATIDDIDVELFRKEYLPKAIAADVLADDSRTVERQMAALNFYSGQYNCPTYAGLILFGRNPMQFLFGDYIQFVQFGGSDNASDILNQQEFRGNLVNMLPQIDTFIATAIAKKRPVPVTVLREVPEFEYPKWPIRELVMNAVIHRDYRGNAPTKFYQYKDRLEITNPGGLYGKANAENFPNVSDYRNPVIAQAMAVMGYVNKFGRGISRVQKELQDNGNAPAVFSMEWVTVFTAQVPSADDEGSVRQYMVRTAKNALIAALKDEKKSVVSRYIKIFDVIAKNPTVTYGALIDAIGSSKRTIAVCVDRMKSIGVLVRKGGRHGGSWEIVAPKENANG